MRDWLNGILKDAAVKVFLARTTHLVLVFILVFYGADIITIFRGTPRAVNFVWEENIPFLPAFYLIYYSVFILYLLIAVILHKSPDDIRFLTRRMMVCIALAGIAFIIFPVKSGYLPLPECEVNWITKITWVVAGRYNMLPSLHVALTIIIIKGMWIRLRPWLKGLMLAWGAALVVSTLFTHQHHILDVLTGVILAFSIGLFVKGGDKAKSI